VLAVAPRRMTTPPSLLLRVSIAPCRVLAVARQAAYVQMRVANVSIAPCRVLAVARAEVSLRLKYWSVVSIAPCRVLAVARRRLGTLATRPCCFNCTLQGARCCTKMTIKQVRERMAVSIAPCRVLAVARHI